MKNEVAKVPVISRNVTSLIKEGVQIDSDAGINDTSSFEKEITAVVSVKFEVR